MPDDLLIAQTANSPILIEAVAILAAVLLLLVGTMIIRRRATERRISRISEEIRKTAEGDLSTAIDASDSGKLRPIVAALNTMSANVDRQMNALRARLQEQHLVHESMSSGLIAMDCNQRIISINGVARRLLGLGDDSIDGLLLRDISVEPELKRFVVDALQHDSRLSREFELHGRQGAIVEAVAEPLRDGQDQSAGLLVLMNDLTRLRKLEAMRSDFAANVSHELRTPITNISGYVETLLEVGVSDPQQTAKFLDIVKRNADRLRAIIEDLLELARLEGPGAAQSIERCPTPVRLIVEATLSQFESAARAKNITVEFDLPSQLSANVNSRMIDQALGNLLSNAIKYSPEGSMVTVRAAAIDEHDMEIAVIDQGAGIAPKHLPRLFERFYRVDKARSRQMGGTGLGLAIVKHIAQVHGGRVEVESELGRGSTFRIILPRD